MFSAGKNPKQPFFIQAGEAIPLAEPVIFYIVKLQLLIAKKSHNILKNK
jgi:hypothetical protein